MQLYTCMLVQQLAGYTWDLRPDKLSKPIIGPGKLHTLFLVSYISNFDEGRRGSLFFIHYRGEEHIFSFQSVWSK